MVCPKKRDTTFMELVIPTATVLVYSLVCLSLGLRLTHLTIPSLDSKSSSNWLLIVCTAFLLGQATLGIVWQLLSIASFFREEVVIVACLLSFIAGVPLIRYVVLNGALEVQRAIKGWLQATIWWKFAIILIVAIVCVYFLHTFLPPQPRGDALAYYMAYPRLIADTGDIGAIPRGYESFAMVGIYGEMHFAVLMLFGNFINPDLFAWFTALAGTGMLIALGHRVGIAYRGSWLIVAALFTSSAFTIIIWDGKVDIFGMALGLAAYYWAFYLGENQRAALILGGLFTGFAIIAKISYAIFLPVTIAGIIFWQLYNTNEGKRLSVQFAVVAIRVGLILAFWGAIPAIPHVIKNTILFDAPLAPVIAENNEALIEQSWFTPETTNRILITYPFSLTFGSFWAQGGQISPLLLALLPLLFFLKVEDKKQRKLLVQITVVALGAIVLWSVIRASVFAPRYMFSPLLLFVLPIALAVEQVSSAKTLNRFSLITPIVVSFIIIISILQVQTALRFAVDTFLGQADECDYEFTNSDGSCRIARIVNEGASEGDQVLWFSYYTYWLRTDLSQCAILSSNISITQNWDDLSESDVDNIWYNLSAYDVEYVVVDQLTHGIFYDVIFDQLPDWVTLETFFDESTYLGLRIDYNQEQRPNNARLICEQIADNRWQAPSIDALIRQTSP